MNSGFNLIKSMKISKISAKVMEWKNIDGIYWNMEDDKDEDEVDCPIIHNGKKMVIFDESTKDIRLKYGKANTKIFDPLNDIECAGYILDFIFNKDDCDVEEVITSPDMNSSMYISKMIQKETGEIMLETEGNTSAESFCAVLLSYFGKDINNLG